MKHTNPSYEPFSPIFILALPFVIYWMGYGCAWYWCKLRGWVFTPELIEFGVAVTAFYSVLNIMTDVLKKYARSKTRDVENEEERERKTSNIQMTAFAVFAIILAATGWIALEVARL